jgi:lysophospholipase L1-like esterase
MGDSITYGQNVLNTPTNHWTYHLAKSLAARLGVTLGRGPIWLSYRMGGVVESALTVGAGWSDFGSNSSYGAGMKTAAATTTTSIDVLFPEAVDGANVLWQTGGGNTGDLIYSWDGGAQVTVANPGGSYALTNTYIPAPNLGTHTLKLWQKGSAGFQSYYVAAEPQDSTTRKVRWSATGVSGKTSSELWTTFNVATTISPAGYLNAWKADAFVLCIGANDQMQIGGAVTTATFTGNLENIRAKVAANAYPTSMVYLGPPPSQNEATWTPRLADFMDASEAWGRTSGVPVVRLDTRWKNWVTTSAEPYAYYGNPGAGGSDSIHPGGNGTPDMGAAVSRVIANEA